MKKIYFLLLCIFFGLFACSLNNIQTKTVDINDGKKAYIRLGIDSGRTINPENVDKTTLNYVLSGVVNGVNKLLGQFTYAQLATANIELDIGKWDFTLVAKKSDNEVLCGTILQKDIVAGNNTLSFSMHELEEGDGSIVITVLMPKDTIAKVRCVLSDSDTDVVADTQSLNAVDCSSDASKSQIVYMLNNVNKGYYDFNIELYQNETDVTPINTRSVLIRVEPNFVSSGSINFDIVNTTYQIIYHFNGIDLTSDYILPTSYNGSMYTNLPNVDDMSADILFYGWYDNPAFKGNEVTKIGYNSTGDKEFWAKTMVGKSCSELAAYLATLDSSKGPYYIPISDTIPNLSTIRSALRAYPEVKVNLDLSHCNGLTTIGANTLKDCTSLTGLRIPDSVTSIGAGALSGCSNLTHLTIPFVGGSKSATSASSSTLFGYIFGTSSYTGGTATKQYYASNSSTYYIPTSLKSVTVTGGRMLYGAFYNCSGLTSVEIGDGVTSIGDRAFYNCSGLTSIDIPDGVTSIGDEAFYGCSGLTSIEIPDSVTSIAGGTLSGCSSLEHITIPFVGGSKDATEASSSTVFGYIFGGYYTGGTATTQYYISGSSWTYYIPSSLKSVTVIGGQLLYGAFYGCSGLESIEIPDNVTSIGNYAFYGCSGLESIEIPDSVTSIGYAAFYGCSSLTSIEIPDSVTSIGGSAFSGCTGLTSVEIGNGVTSIGSYAFRDCSGLTSVDIPSGVTSIGYAAFSGCSGLTSIEIPDGVTSIEECAFSGCSGLTSVEIPDSVTSIGTSAFSGCSNLTHITIPFVGGSKDATEESASTVFGYIFGTSSYTGGTATTQYYKSGSSATYYIPSTLKSVTVIGGQLLYGAFYNCGNLTSIEIPDSVTSIGNYAFYGCSGLTSIDIPDSVTSIGNRAFSRCTGLTSIDIPDGVTSIGSSAFSGCSNLTHITIPFVGGSKDATEESASTVFGYIFGTSSYTGGTSTNQYYNSSYSSARYYIPSSLKKVIVTGGNLLYGAFYGCSGLTSIVIGDGVTSIGDSAFYECSGLTSIVVGSANTKYDSRNGCNAIIDKTTNSLIVGCKNTIIPNSVTSIGDEAFYGCSGLTSIEIPDSVTSIGDEAFYRCSGLTTLTCKAITPPTLGTDMLYNCSNLTAIGVPYASVEDYQTASGWSDYASKILGCLKLSELEDCLLECDSDTTIYKIKISNEDFDWDTFQHILSSYPMTQVSLDLSELTSLTSITASDWNGCNGVVCINRIPTSLTSVVIPDSVTSIGEGALSGCCNLEHIRIPFVGGSKSATTASSSTVFGYIFGRISYDGGTATEQHYSSGNSYYTYYIPTSLKSVTVTGGNMLYGAFYGCSGLTSIDIPDSVTSIGGSAFYGCSGLTSIEIPDRVKYIGGSAFYGCSGLTSIVIGDSVTYIEDEAFYRCSGLTTLICKAVTYPTFASSALSGCTSLTKIYVPEESVSNYKSANGWRKFADYITAIPSE